MPRKTGNVFFLTMLNLQHLFSSFQSTNHCVRNLHSSTTPSTPGGGGGGGVVAKGNRDVVTKHKDHVVTMNTSESTLTAQQSSLY